MPSENIDQNGLYFIANGELYKGAQRFGLGRVTKASTSEELDAIQGKARGDINVGYQGAKVWDGTAWQQLGGDIDSLTASWRADISAWTAGLSTGGEGSYITGIIQDEDGMVTASAEAFPALATGDAAGQVKLGSVNATVSGWATLVSSVADNASSIGTLGSKVSAIEGIVNPADGGAISASSGTFTNLVVTSTATFSVTNVSAESLTVNGSTVEQITNAQIAAISAVTATSASNGIAVSVTTESGSVTAVSVDATSFGNVMHFAGVVSAPSAITTPTAGDIVVIGSQPATGYVTGQEYIYAATNTWELIGDQSTYALNAYTSTATVLAAATTLPTAIDALGAAVDTLNSSVATLISSMTSVSSVLAGLGDAAQKSVATTLDSSATTLPTCAAVAAYISAAIASAMSWIED